MRFAKRLVELIQIKEGREVTFIERATDTKLVTVFAHEDEQTGSQLIGVESVDKVTGEVVSQRINLPVETKYILTIKEVLEVQE